jgi:serine/threonine-protein kinase
MLAGKYKLTRLLGEGGMGAVFDATNQKTERRVAIKIMLSSDRPNPDLATRFLREARAASRITHPNVVDVLDMGEDDDGTPFIVQEYLNGSDLRRLLTERRSLSPRETLEIIAPVMSALCAAHKQKIVHRDLKPENIFLVRSGTGATVPKLIDFGLARIDTGDGLSLTKSGAAFGTPYYMSPEQAKGERDPNGVQTDIWAMGVVVFEMLAGRCPFEGDNANAIMAQILMAPVPRVDAVATRVPKSLADIVARALERDRSIRYRTMAQFLGALLDCSDIGDDVLRKSLKTLSGDFGDEGTVVDDGLTTTQKQPPKPNASTLGRSAREITTRIVGGSAIGRAVAIVAVLGAVAATVAISRRAPAPAVSAAVTPRVSIPTTPMLGIAVATRPSSAAITLDGTPVGIGAFAQTVPIDGREHFLRVSAAGYESQTIAFRDVAPPPMIELVPMAVVAVVPTAARRPTAPRAVVVTPVPAAPTAPPQAAPIVPTPEPTPLPSVNGAPIITQEQ